VWQGSAVATTYVVQAALYNCERFWVVGKRAEHCDAGSFVLHVGFCNELGLMYRVPALLHCNCH
jgi:hypothetical protein